jgi:hypothetical protein
MRLEFHPSCSGDRMTFSALTPSSRIEVINQLATGSRSVNVTERGAGGWQVRHARILAEAWAAQCH